MKLAQDKIKHIIALLYITLLVGIWHVAIGVVAGTLAIIGKEVYDKAHPESHQADLGDVLAGFVGMALGLIVIYILSLIVYPEDWLACQSYVTAYMLFIGFCFYWFYCRVGGNKLF